tara:strand:+ start:703 stop:1164 length:462 start_codon:yes stop_codon:yes gene_type:complete
MSGRVKSNYFVEATLKGEFQRRHAVQLRQALCDEYPRQNLGFGLECITEGGIVWVDLRGERPESQYKSIRFPFHNTWPWIGHTDTLKSLFDNDIPLHPGVDIYGNPAKIHLMYKVKDVEWTNTDNECVLRALKKVDCIDYAYLDLEYVYMNKK